LRFRHYFNSSEKIPPMSWLTVLAMGAAGALAMRAAFEHGDVEEAARRGALAGPVVIEQALGEIDSRSGIAGGGDPDGFAGGAGVLPRGIDRMTQLAAIAAAPLVEDRAELLAALAKVAGGANRRTAIPAAAAARTIARELLHQDRPDDIAPADVAAWRTAWAELAMRGDRWIELRVLALDTAAALDPAGTGVDLAAALADPDPAFRRAVASIVPLPAPVATYAPLAGAIVRDGDPGVALAAAQSLCLSLQPTSPRPILDALGAAGLARLRALVTEGNRSTAVRDAARCLAADSSPESAAALRSIAR
jgi:hypothetical protein